MKVFNKIKGKVVDGEITKTRKAALNINLTKVILSLFTELCHENAAKISMLYFF